MNWVLINFYTQNAPEIMDVSTPEFSKKKKINWTMFLLKSLSVCTYIPTGIQLAKYVLRNKNYA